MLWRHVVASTGWVTGVVPEPGGPRCHLGDVDGGGVTMAFVPVLEYASGSAAPILGGIW